MRKKILVVDDERAITFAIRSYFTQAGYEVACADGSDAAIPLIDRDDYDLAILDLRLSPAEQVGGLDLARRVRERSAVPIIMLSAEGSPEIEALAVTIGVDTFLHKPQPLGQLARIASALVESASPKACLKSGNCVPVPETSSAAQTAPERLKH